MIKKSGKYIGLSNKKKKKNGNFPNIGINLFVIMSQVSVNHGALKGLLGKINEFVGKINVNRKIKLIDYDTRFFIF